MLRLDKDRPDAFLPGLSDRRLELGRLGLLAFGLDGHLLQAVGLGEVAPGGMEHEKFAAGLFRQHALEFRVEFVELLHEPIVVFLVAGGPGRVRADKPIPDGGGLDLDRAGRQPDMGVRFTVGVVPGLARFVGMPAFHADLRNLRVGLNDRQGGAGGLHFFHPRLFEGNAQGEIDPGPCKLGHLSGLGLVILRVGTGRHHHGHCHGSPPDFLDKVFLGQNADDNRQRLRIAGAAGSGRQGEPEQDRCEHHPPFNPSRF